MQNQVLLFHRTVGAEYDDRIQKIFGSLNRQSGVEAHAILWERSNQAKEGKFKAGGNYEVVRLPFASKRMPRPGPIWSLYEILAESWTGYRKVVENDPTVVVVQNHRLFGLVELVTRRSDRRFRLVWDLRELPTGFMKKGSLRSRYFSSLLEKCDAVIVTNESRRWHMKEVFGETALKKSVAVPNYPDRSFGLEQGFEEIDFLSGRLASKRYFYLQNPSSEARYPIPTVEAVLQYTDLSVVVSGRIEKRAQAALESEWGEEFRERVILAGMVSRENIISLLDRCAAALVFYNWDRPNSNFCDPNRLYQAIARGVPVVVGANTGMKAIIEELGCGVVAEGDGRSSADTGKTLRSLLEGYGGFRTRAIANRKRFCWEKNEEILTRAIFGEVIEGSLCRNEG